MVANPARSNAADSPSPAPTPVPGASRPGASGSAAQPARPEAAKTKPSTPAERFRRANVAEFDKLRGEPNAVVVDVRTAEEFADGHLPQAGLVDIKSKDFLATISKLDRSKLYLVNCAVGGRSSRACQSFAALGFTNVVNLEGGFNAWKAAKPDAISKDPAIALPKAAGPNSQ